MVIKDKKFQGVVLDGMIQRVGLLGGEDIFLTRVRDPELPIALFRAGNIELYTIAHLALSARFSSPQVIHWLTDYCIRSILEWTTLRPSFGLS